MGAVPRRSCASPRRRTSRRRAVDARLVAFGEAMDDDLNTPGALAALHELVREGHSAIERGETRDRVGDPRGGRREGLERARVSTRDDPTSAPTSSVRWSSCCSSSATAARAAKDFARADEIRDRLAEIGVVVEDSPQGARWFLRVSQQIEGRRPVIEALRAKRPIAEILIASGAKSAARSPRSCRLAERRGVRVREIPRRELEERAESRNPQGVIASTAAFRVRVARRAARAGRRRRRRRRLLVALDGVTDPQNLGALARSAEAAGAHGLIVPTTPSGSRDGGGREGGGRRARASRRSRRWRTSSARSRS